MKITIIMEDEADKMLRQRNIHKTIAIVQVVLVLCSILTGAGILKTMGSEEKNETSAYYMEPVFYENESGPVIGTTYANILSEDGLFFKDSNSNGELDAWEDWREDAQVRAQLLVNELSLEAKAGLTINALWTDPKVSHLEDAMDDSGKILIDRILPADPGIAKQKNLSSFDSSYLQNDHIRAGVYRSDLTKDPSVIAAYSNIANQICEEESVKNGEPMVPFALISNPIYAGLSGTLGIAAATMGEISNGGDYSLVRKYAEMDARLWTASGLRIMYGPQIDLLTDPRWSRNKHTFGEVPEVVSGIITALIEGYQGENGLNEDSVALVVKHFPGDGASENGFEAHRAIGQWRVYATENSLETYQLPAFQAAVDAGAAAIMPGYSRSAADARSVPQSYHGAVLMPEERANAYNEEILIKLLREIMGFTGYINSDSAIITSKDYGVEELSEVQKYALAISSGIDVIGDIAEPALIVQAVEAGLLDEADLDRACINHLTCLFRMGLFENPYYDPDLAEQVQEEYMSSDLLEEINRKSVVLLKNTNDTLPLKSHMKIYVRSFTAKGESQRTTEQLQNAFEEAGFEIVEEPEYADAVYLHITPTLVNTDHMAVLDLVSHMPVEERNDPISQEKTGNMVICTTVDEIEEIPGIARVMHDKGGLVIGVINLESPWILTNLEPYCDALLGVFSTSPEAQADIISGTVSPSGKLPVTLPSCSDAIAVYEMESDGKVYEICVSPNDVPGYDKDLYMDQEILDILPGNSYAYCDSEGNYYKVWFGLTYE